MEEVSIEKRVTVSASRADILIVTPGTGGAVMSVDILAGLNLLII